MFVFLVRGGREESLERQMFVSALETTLSNLETTLWNVIVF